MSTAPKKPDGTKPAIKPAGGMLNDRRIRLLWISPMIPLPILPAA